MRCTCCVMGFRLIVCRPSLLNLRAAVSGLVPDFLNPISFPWLRFCFPHHPRRGCNDAMVFPIGDPNDSTTGSIRHRLFQSLPGPQQVLKALTGSLSISSLSGSDIGTSQNTFQHCSQPELSCQTRYRGQDTCCFNYPSGQFLQSQFWDADPAIGPEDSWTIHGLW